MTVSVITDSATGHIPHSAERISSIFNDYAQPTLAICYVYFCYIVSVGLCIACWTTSGTFLAVQDFVNISLRYAISALVLDMRRGAYRLLSITKKHSVCGWTKVDRSIDRSKSAK